MAEAVQFCKDLENEIVKASEVDGLNEVRQALTDYESRVAPTFEVLLKYEKQKIVDAVDKVRKLIEAKKSVLNRKPFEFIGDPILIQQARPVTYKAAETAIEPTYKGLVYRKQTVSSFVNHMYVDNVRNSIIVNDNFSNLITINGGDACIYFLSTKGTVHVTNLNNSVLVVACHQLRIHKSTRCKVIAKISTTVIIENCRSLSFSRNVKVDDFDCSFLQNSSNYDLQPFEASEYQWINNVPNGPFNQDTREMLLASTEFKP